MFQAPSFGAPALSTEVGASAQNEKNFTAALEALKKHAFPAGHERDSSLDTPQLIVRHVHTLISAVDRTPAPHEPSNLQHSLWERLHSSLADEKLESVVKCLFDCLEALSPCSERCICNADTAPPTGSDDVQVGVEDRVHSLSLNGLACRRNSQENRGERLNPRQALAEVLQLHLQIMLALMGILRNAWRVVEWKYGPDKKPAILHWHEELGLLPYVLERLFHAHQSSVPGDSSQAPQSLLHRMYLLSHCLQGEGMLAAADQEDALIACLQSKCMDAYKLLMFSTFDVEWRPSRALALREDCKWFAQGRLPSHVVVALFYLQILSLEEVLSAPPGQTARFMDTLRGISCIHQTPLSGDSISFLTEQLFLDRATVMTIGRGFEAVAQMARSSWLLASNVSDSSAVWESEWEHVMASAAREMLLEAVGMVSLALEFLSGARPLYDQYRDILHAVADDAVQSVTSGWSDHLLDQRFGTGIRGVQASHGTEARRSFQGGIVFLIASSMQLREVLAEDDDEQIPRCTSVVNMSFMLADPELTPQWLPDYDEQLVRAAAALSVGSQSLDAGVRSTSMFESRKGLVPSRGMLEALRSMRFCLDHTASAVDIAALEAAMAGGMSRTLSNVAMVAAKHYCKLRLADAHEEAARLQWQEVAALALECIGAFGEHAEFFCGVHEQAVELVQDMALFFESEAVVGYGRGFMQEGWRAPREPEGLSHGGQGLKDLFLQVIQCFLSNIFSQSSGDWFARSCQQLHLRQGQVLQAERDDGLCRLAITNALLNLAGRLLLSFNRHFGSQPTTAAGNASMEDDDGAKVAATNAAMSLARMEDAAMQPEKQERIEWKMGEAAGSRSIHDRRAAWGWYSPYPTNRSVGSVCFHALVPLVHFFIEGVLPMCSGMTSAVPVADLVEQPGLSYEELSTAVLAREGAREQMQVVSKALSLLDSILSEEVLILTLLRTDSFLRLRHPHVLERAHVGCAGIQDRPELHLFVYRRLERELGPCLHLLKLQDSTSRASGAVPVPHKGIDHLACSAMSILQRLTLYRADPQVAVGDHNLEGAAFQLASSVVSCMCRPSGSNALPPLFQTELPVAVAASRLLSVVCRVNSLPLTIRQSWAQAPENVANLQKQALLDIATSHNEDVSTRVAVMAFLTEALSSQPGLADWLFEAEGDVSTVAGRAEGGAKDSITLDTASNSEDGQYAGWIVEIRGGKGIGQLARVINGYDGKTKVAKVSVPWDEKLGLPDATSQYVLCKQLNLRRVVKALLHADLAYSGTPGSDRELDRLKVLEHSLMLVDTIWDAAPEERAAIVQGFSDPDCLPWGFASPQHKDLVNASAQWRSCMLRLHTAGGKRICAKVSAAANKPFVEESADGAAGVNAKKVTVNPDKDGKVLGWLKPEAPSGGTKPASFWDVIRRSVLCDWGKNGMEIVADGKGDLYVKFQMPKSLKRQPLPMLDGAKGESPLIKFLKDKQHLADVLDPRRDRGRSRFSRDMFSDLQQLAAGGEAAAKRVAVELRIVDATMQELEEQGLSRAESADVALGQLWDRVHYKLQFSDMDGEPRTLMKPVKLPFALRGFLYRAITDAGNKQITEEDVARLWLQPQGAVAHAVEATCRRMHIEALAVSIAAMHIEEEAVRSGLRDSTEDKEERQLLVRHLAQRAVQELEAMVGTGLPGASQEGMEMEGEDGPGNESALQLGMWTGVDRALQSMQWLQRVAYIPPKQQQTVTHPQRVQQKLSSLLGFSEDWHFDCRRAREAAGVQMEAMAVGLNQDQAIYDLRCLVSLSYCRFLQAAACTSPALLIKALCEAPTAGGQSLLHRLLEALSQRLVLSSEERVLGGDLEVKAALARTLSVLVHCGWPLESGAKKLAAGTLPAAQLLATLADALAAAAKGTAQGGAAEGAEVAQQREVLYDSLIDCLLRLLLYVQDVRALAEEPLDVRETAPVPSAAPPSSFGAAMAGRAGGGGGLGTVTGPKAVVRAEESVLLDDLEKDLHLLVRLSSTVGGYLQQASPGPCARKSCALLVLLVRMCRWTDAVHWESLLDQAFWTQAPGLFRWISGGSAEGADSVAQKEGAIDALAALDVIVEVAKTGKGALVLASHSFMLFLRQGPLNTRVLRTDAEQLPLYVGSGNSRYRNLWHQVWCQALMSVHVLTLKLSGRDQHMSELLAFVVTYMDRLTRVLMLACELKRHPRSRKESRNAQPHYRSGGVGAGLAGGLSSQDLQDAELGRIPSLALLEEAKLWSAVLLRLSRRFRVWAPHVPQLAQVLLELIPEVVAALTYCLHLWGSDTAAFEARLRPVSQEEQAQARFELDGAAGGGSEEPSGAAKTILDKEIKQAVEAMSSSTAKDGRTLKYSRQRSAFYQRLLDTLFATLHNALRIMCCCEDDIRPHIDRTIQRFTNGGGPFPGDAQGLNMMVGGQRGSRCSLGTLVASTEAAISFLALVIQVEVCCDKSRPEIDGRQGAGEWQEEVDGLLHRRGMLLRVAECCAVLLGRFAADVDMRDSCSELVLKLKALLESQDADGTQNRSSGQGLQVAVSAPAGKGRLTPRARQRRAQITTTIAFMRSAMRAIFETL